MGDKPAPETLGHSNCLARKQATTRAFPAELRSLGGNDRGLWLTPQAIHSLHRLKRSASEDWIETLTGKPNVAVSKVASSLLLP